MEPGLVLVNALLFGNLSEVPELTQALFARTGLTHLFSASGFHLNAALSMGDLFAGFLQRFLRSARQREATRFLCQLALMIFFGFATGWSSPMLRAFTYSALQALARFLEVNASRHWIFLLSLVVSAVLGKGGTLSFLLSAFGMAGLLYARPRGILSQLLGPWLFTLPLCLWCFGVFPLLAPLWNLTFGSLISLLVMPPAILALVLKALALPAPYLEQFAALTMEQLVRALFLSDSLLGGAYWVSPYPCALLSFLFLLGGLLWQGGKKLSAAMLVLVATGAALGAPEPALLILDVGQGDAIYLRTENGSLLSDVGPPAYSGGMAPVARALESRGIGELDNLMLSHFDLDHRGGLDSLLARHRVLGSLWFREENLAAAAASEVLGAAERASLPIRFLRREKAPPGLSCWLAPFANGNNSSPLCRAEVEGAGSVLLTGDMGEQAERWFLSHLRPFPRALFLKVAHHGSRTSSTREFLSASGAREAMISVGDRNRYHHPTPETLRRLEQAELLVRRTDLEGSLAVYPWKRMFRYLSLGFFTEEIMRPPPEISREYPGIPAAASRL